MTDDGIVTLGERFKGIEDTLSRIEGKLDTKVGFEVFNPLVHRVELLENAETPLGRVMLAQFTQMQTQLNDIVLHGSENAREAVQDVERVKARLDAVESTGVTARAVLTDRQTRQNRSYKILGVLVGLVSSAGVILGSVALFVHP